EEFLLVPGTGGGVSTDKNKLPANHAARGKKRMCRDPHDPQYNAGADLFFLVAEKLPQKAASLDLHDFAIILNAYANVDETAFGGHVSMLSLLFERSAQVIAAKIALLGYSE
ncbi:unnamed protein product, partial [Amoebophrya sp. A25]